MVIPLHTTKTLIILGGKFLRICIGTENFGFQACHQTHKKLQCLGPYLFLHMFEHMSR